MKAFQPYLNFDGSTRDAMTFYTECFGGDLYVMTFAEANTPMPSGNENRVMHARLASGNGILMASDSMPGKAITQGNNVWVNVDCESVEEIDRLFAAMARGGTVVMPLADQFWDARFGMLTDKFGINWMFNCQLKK
ncbi:MAG TPA: VOC family protein [Gemmatimonadaceae bacterium]